jgi:beta-glucanase (GH16 family)
MQMIKLNGLLLLIILACGAKKEEPTPVVVPPVTNPPVVEEEFNAKSCGLDQMEADVTKDGWTMIFKEEFGENLKDWKIWTGGAFNNEYQYYNYDKNLSLKDGVLKITPKREFITGAENPFSTNQKSFNFTSGRIESGNKFSPKGVNYNSLRIVSRVKTPPGTGMWPAFWLYGDAWPTNGEIDILEQDGAKPTEFSSTYHYGTTVNADQWNAIDLGFYKSNDNLTRCWHLFECVWEKEKITYYFDGKEYFVNKGRNVPAMWDKMQNIVFNLAVGGNFVGNPPPANIQLNPMYVDWVRVFSKEIN